GASEPAREHVQDRRDRSQQEHRRDRQLDDVPDVAERRRVEHARYALGATERPRAPLRSIRSATNPEAFTSATNSRRYCAPAGRPFGVATACWIAVKRPSRIFAPGIRCTSRTRRGRSPASASSLSEMKRAYEASRPSERTSSACFNARLRYRSYALRPETE